MESDEISDAQLGVFIALPVCFFVMIVVAVCCCYWKQSFCFETKRDDVLLPATRTTRCTVDLSSRSRRNSSYVSDSGSFDRASLDDDTTSGNLKFGTYVQSPFAYPDITHSAPVGQASREGKRQRTSLSSLQVPTPHGHSNHSSSKSSKYPSNHSKLVPRSPHGLQRRQRQVPIRLEKSEVNSTTKHIQREATEPVFKKDPPTAYPITPQVSIHFDHHSSFESENALENTSEPTNLLNNNTQRNLSSTLLSPSSISDSKSADMLTTKPERIRRTSFDLQLLRKSAQHEDDSSNEEDETKHSPSESVVNYPGSERRRSSMQMPIDLNQIDPRLYQWQSTQWPSIDVDPNEDSGSSQINFIIKYNREIEVFSVNLIQAINLPIQDGCEVVNPYCTVALEPGYSQRKTKVHHQTCSPEFEETFVFSVSPAALKEQTLVIKSYCFDRFSMDECTAILKLNLRDIDFVLTPSIDLRRRMDKVKDHEPAQACALRGDLLLSIAYLQTAEKLKVTVHKARNLQLVNTRKTPPDIYVKVCLYNGSMRLKKKKTTTVPSCTNPVFNQALNFNVSQDTLQAIDTELVCCVVHDFKLGNNIHIGKLKLAKNCDDAGAQTHWSEVVSQSSNGPIARWHCLKPPPPLEEQSPEHESLPSYARRKSLAVLDSLRSTAGSSSKGRNSYS